MATAPLKSQPLHNFSLPFLKWGATTNATTQQQNRGRMPQGTDISEPDNDLDHNDSVRPHRVGSRSSRVQRLSFSSTTKVQKDATERLQKQTTTDLEREAGEKTVKVGVEKNETEEEGEEEHEEIVVGKPWNLRPRKGFQEALVNAGIIESHHQTVSVNTKPKSMRLREMVESRGNPGEKKEKSRFWITLSREEIEEDIFVMTGSRPARRPRKRPKNVQKQLDNVFPGLWLVGLTVDAYRVTDAPMKRAMWLQGIWEFSKLIWKVGKIAPAILKPQFEASLHRWGAEWQACI